MDLEFLQGALEVCGVGNNRYPHDPATKQREFVVDNSNNAVALRGVRADEFHVQGGEVIGANHYNVFGWSIIDRNRSTILALAQNRYCTRGNQSSGQDEHVDEWCGSWNAFKARECEQHRSSHDAGGR